MKAILGNAYEAQGLLASAQRCANLYAEVNPADSPFPTTHYLTPGLETVATADKSGWRALYVATTGALYGVVADTIYRIKFTAGAYVLTSIGTLGTSVGPVSMVDNGIDVVMVDGSSGGRTINLSIDLVTSITSPAFYGANRVDLLDGFLLFNRPQTNQFYISAFLNVSFDALDFAAKTGFSDKLVGVAATKRQIFLFGAQTTEVWYNTGDADFTFGRMPGAFIQHGCVSAASLCQFDGSIYWLSKSPQGEYMVLRTEGYDRARMSTFAIEKALKSYPDISDVNCYIYQQDGHAFYVMNFPAADKTWVYDIAANMWHERFFMDDEGNEHRHRSNCHAYFNGETLVGDWENGKLYRMSTDIYTDDGEEIRRIRSFPHMVDDGNRVTYWAFRADIQTGEGLTASFEGAELRLRWSDTRGASWGQHISGTLAPNGDYLHSCMFQRLGMARDRVFELSWAADCKTSLNGAFVSALPGTS